MELHRDYQNLDVPCGTHLHMYMKIKNMTTASPLNCHDCSRFDLEDPTLLVDGKPKVYHGQYALAKNKTKLIQYLAKEGLHINQSITSGGLIFEMIVKTLEKEEILKKYGATTYMAFLLQTELKSVVNTFSKQLNNAKTRFKFYQNDTSHQEPEFDYQDMQKYVFPEELIAWYEKMQKSPNEMVIQGPQKRKRTSFLMYGKSCIGKTTGIYKFFLEKGFLPEEILIASNRLCLQKVRPTTKVIIFDDFIWSKVFPIEKSHIISMECNRSLNIAEQSVDLGKQVLRVIICNNLKQFFKKGDEKDALLSRLTVYQQNDVLYESPIHVLSHDNN